MKQFDQTMEQLVATAQDAFSRAGFEPIGEANDLDDVKTAPGGKMCLGMECLDRDLWDETRAIDLIGKLGIYRTRLQTGWQKTEKEKGVYDFAWLDKVVDKLLSMNIRPFLSLSYGNKLYCANPEDCPNLENGGVGHIPVRTPEEREGWRNYVRATVTHFRDRVTDYEIWNEPDVAIFCRTNMAWPDAYMELVKLTQPVIREACPEATVITCTAGFEALHPLIDRGIGDYADVHSFHAYQFFPELSSNDYYLNHASLIRKVAPHLRLWRGEAGCPSYNDPISIGALSDVKVSETKQAKFVLRHLLCDLSNDLLECSSYFHAYDFEHFTHKLRYYYGVIRHEPLSRKPSYHCLQMLSHLFDGDTTYGAANCLTFRKDDRTTLTPEQRLLVRFGAFTRKGVPFYTYYLPTEIVDEITVNVIAPDLPDSIESPVVIDLLTRKVYAVKDGLAPITQHPMALMNAEAAREFATFETVQDEKKEEVFTQRIEA